MTPKENNTKSSAKPAKQPKKLPLKNVRARLRNRFGIPDDELDVLFPDEDKLREAYDEAVKASSKEANQQTEMEGADEYKLTEAEAARLIVDDTALREAKVATKVKAQMSLQGDLPEGVQVTEEEAAETAKSLEDLNLDDLDDEG